MSIKITITTRDNFPKLHISFMQCIWNMQNVHEKYDFGNLKIYIYFFTYRSMLTYYCLKI